MAAVSRRRCSSVRPNGRSSRVSRINASCMSESDIRFFFARSSGSARTAPAASTCPSPIGHAGPAGGSRHVWVSGREHGPSGPSNWTATQAWASANGSSRRWWRRRTDSSPCSAMRSSTYPGSAKSSSQLNAGLSDTRKTLRMRWAIVMAPPSRLLGSAASARTSAPPGNAALAVRTCTRRAVSAVSGTPRACRSWTCPRRRGSATNAATGFRVCRRPAERGVPCGGRRRRRRA